MKFSQALVIVNPVAGQCDPAQIRAEIKPRFEQHGIDYTIHETSPDDDLLAVIQQAKPLDLVVVAGGDGTISAAVDALAHTETPLGILPVGTANILAKDLHVPAHLADACQLLVEDHRVRAIDLMDVAGKFAISHVSMGFYALESNQTPPKEKRLWGLLAYLKRVGQRLAEGNTHWQFSLEIDGQPFQTDASLVLVVNAGPVGIGQLRWGSNIHPDDGQLDLIILTAEYLLTYIRILERSLLSETDDHPAVQHYTATREIVMRCKKPLPIQVDGERLGEQAVQIQLRPHALRVLAPQ